MYIAVLCFSTIALCKLLQHALTSNDSRLQDIQVQGERIAPPNEGIRTRQKAKQSMLWSFSYTFSAIFRGLAWCKLFFISLQ